MHLRVCLSIKNILQVFDDLHAHGFFYNPIVKAVETEVLPWLLQGLNASVGEASDAQTLLESFVAAVPAAQAAKHKASKDKEEAIQAEKNRIAAEVIRCALAVLCCFCAERLFSCAGGSSIGG
jgi:hypothetical protein